MKISGKLCINFEVDTKKFKRDYVNFLYNVAVGVLKNWNQYYEGIYLSIEEDGYVELDKLLKTHYQNKSCKKWIEFI